MQEDLIPGFSHEYINYMLGGAYRSSFRPLNDAVMAGRIRGLAAVVGCNNPRSSQDYLHNYVTMELLKQDVLQKVWVLRKLLYPMDDLEATEFLVDKVKQTKNNAEFFDSMRRG